MARPRKPLTAHKADGTFRKDRHGDRREPRVSGEPECPAWLDGDALDYWRQEVPGLIASGSASSQDGSTLAEMCECYAMYRRLVVLLKDDPIDKPTRCECVVWFDRWVSLARDFGMTPKARSALKVVGEPEKPAGDARKLKFFKGA